MRQITPYPSLSRVFRHSIKAALGGLLLLSLSGCLLMSPFWNQQFSNHTNVIPLQSFTTDASLPVKFQCAQAAHFGLYPSEPEAVWVTIANVNPTTPGLLDPLSNLVYGAGINTALPASCWRQDPANSVWYAAVRATQGSGASLQEYQTFNKAGLECLGRENGKATSWFGWIGKNCAATYSGSSTTVRYVIVWAPV